VQVLGAREKRTKQFHYDEMSRSIDLYFLRKESSLVEGWFVCYKGKEMHREAYIELIARKHNAKATRRRIQSIHYPWTTHDSCVVTKTNNKSI
jgi:hypothetical protein